MKLFWKKNKILIISILLLLICATFFLVKYKLDFIYETNEHNKMVNYLNEIGNKDVGMLKEPQMFDAYSLFSYLVIDSPFGIIRFFMPFIIMLCGVYTFYSKMKSGLFKDECMRRGYKKNLILNIFDSWKSAFIILIFVVALFIGCYITTGSFDINKTIAYYDYSLVDTAYIGRLPIFCIVYAINLFLLALFYINISLIVAKKNNNLFATLVQSYLVFIMIDIFLEVVIGDGFEYLFPNLYPTGFGNSVALFNYWLYENVISLKFMVVLAFILFLSSTIVLLFTYRNKERVNLEIDK